MINNKMIEGMLRGTAETLTDILKNREKLMNEAKSNLSPKELKSFTALELMVNKQLDNKDFNGAMRTISKYKQDSTKK
jgi:hypothetical protein